MTSTWRDEFKEAYGTEEPRIADGEAGQFRVGIGKVSLKDGSSFIPSRTGVTVVVGGNNSGKSTLLKEIRQVLTGMGYANPGNLTYSIQSLDQIIEGERQDMLAWVAERSQVVWGHYGVAVRFHTNEEYTPIDLMRRYTSGEHPLGALERLVIHAPDGENRFRAIYETDQYDPHLSRPGAPLQYLQDDSQLRNDVSEIFQKVFGHPLELDLLNNRLNLRVGRTGMEIPRLGDIPPEYREAMAALPPVSTQGDGVKSFMGQLLPVVTGAHPIVLLDEPEAFLHPPQARALGEYLGSFASVQGSQVIAATHDKNFMVGLLESGAEVSVVRLARSTGCPSAAQLDSSELRKVWDHPILRYSNILDGLFNQAVVLAESEFDCGFLRATLDEMPTDDHALPKSDILFVPSHGKAGMQTLAKTLQAAAVPVVAVPDLDVLDDKSVISRLVESLGHEWTDTMDKDLRMIHSNVKDNSSDSITVGQVLNNLNVAFENKKDEQFDAVVKDEFKSHTRVNRSYWKTVKKTGTTAFQGESYRAAFRLLESLSKVGIVVVQEGEPEGLARSVSVRKGPGWIRAALEGGAHREQIPRSHVSRIIAAAKEAVERASRPATECSSN